MAAERLGPDTIAAQVCTILGIEAGAKADQSIADPADLKAAVVAKM